MSARQLLISGAVPPPPAAAALYAALDALLVHAGEGLVPAGTQFLRAASEPGMHPPPAVSAAVPPPAVAAVQDDEWEPEDSPTAPVAYGGPSGRGRLRVAEVAGAHPWHSAAPAFEAEEPPSSWGLSLFD